MPSFIPFFLFFCSAISRQRQAVRQSKEALFDGVSFRDGLCFAHRENILLLYAFNEVLLGTEALKIYDPWDPDSNPSLSLLETGLQDSKQAAYQTFLTVYDICRRSDCGSLTD